MICSTRTNCLLIKFSLLQNSYSTHITPYSPEQFRKTFCTINKIDSLPLNSKSESQFFRFNSRNLNLDLKDFFKLFKLFK